MAEFARPFRITYPDGIPEDEVLHGVQFPDGACIVRMPRGGFHAAIPFEFLGEVLDMEHAVVEWADGGGA
ncbi:hypothetical protein Rhe02_54420 [Rhizocola hellebori]|uniref:Uncharacterized protein n=1 Tax=Rhizocola hellebori TaxID=1392758 RepID=A0A8J3VI96_9ACTN|nr:hypothetical protein [Rhizocola hellebori]GIH07375.1 hypothetical protein Rhe02_54420 [Rhizocola hellebori]